MPALNTFAAAFDPGGVRRAILVLNALLGLGTVLAPVFVALFDGLGFWWGMPLTSATLLVALLFVASGCPCGSRRVNSERAGRHPDTGAVLGLRGFAVLYGVCETVNGNWSQLDMTSESGASTTRRPWRSRPSGAW